MSLNELPIPAHRPPGTTSPPHDGPVNVIPAQRRNLMRLPAVEQRTTLKKSTIYAGIKAGTFPAQVRLSARAVGFYEDEIDRWISERAATGGQS